MCSDELRGRQERLSEELKSHKTRLEDELKTDRFGRETCQTSYNEVSGSFLLLKGAYASNKQLRLM